METKGLYNETDQRYNLFQVYDELSKVYKEEDLTLLESEKILKQAESVACLVLESGLNRNAIALNVKTLGAKEKLLEGEIFADEKCLGIGSAFLIGKRHLLTAGHCVCNEDGILDKRLIERLRAVFGFYRLSADNQPSSFNERDIYRIESVVAYELAKDKDKKLWRDWALLCLDREVGDREPLNIKICKEIKLNQPVYMLGHPSGLPMKWTKSAEVKKITKKDYFQASLDAFKGNSGSPVFSEKTGEVIGMLVEGNKDYDVHCNDEGNFKRVHRVEESEISSEGYEKCHKVFSLQFLTSILSSVDIPQISTEGKIKEGLNLVAECNCTKKPVVINLGMGKFDLSEQCAFAKCSLCQEEIHPDNVNTMVLSSCAYSIEGKNIENERIKDGPFPLLKRKDVWFDVSQWKYLEIELSSRKKNPQSQVESPQTNQEGCTLF